MSNATETLLILDFGSQTAQLIARRVRESGVFSLLVSPRITVDDVRTMLRRWQERYRTPRSATVIGPNA